MKVTDSGQIIKDNQIPMICEFKGCTKTKGMDYIRIGKEREKGWEDEPIYLCDEHSKNHNPIK